MKALHLVNGKSSQSCGVAGIIPTLFTHYPIHET